MCKRGQIEHAVSVRGKDRDEGWEIGRARNDQKIHHATVKNIKTRKAHKFKEFIIKLVFLYDTHIVIHSLHAEKPRTENRM